MIIIYQIFYTFLLFVNNKYFHKNNSIYLYILMGIISPLAVYLLKEKALFGLYSNFFDQLTISIIWFLQSNFLLYKAISNKLNGKENFTYIIYLFAISAVDITLYKILCVVFILSIKLNKDHKEHILDYQSIVVMILLYFVGFTIYPFSIYVISSFVVVLLMLQASKIKNSIDFLLAFSLVSLIFKETQINYLYAVVTILIVINLKFFVDKEFFNLIDKTLSSYSLIERVDIILKRNSFYFNLNKSRQHVEKLKKIESIENNEVIIKYKKDYKLTYFLFSLFALYILIKGAIAI